LLEFPTAFPIKIMGLHQTGLRESVLQAVRQADPSFDTGTLEERSSREGRYLGLTVTVTATSQQQLDDLYRALGALPLVKVVL
jgi:putative lipoic acid-binding regulatory protein